MKNEENILVKFLNEWIPNKELTKFGKESKKKIMALIQKPKIGELEWLGAICPICGDEYQYLPDYKPKTCGKFECLNTMAIEKPEEES
ncbi:hypothetical protein KA005_49175 [bacterium]|nr:hypothetical protein [bacterium]